MEKIIVKRIKGRELSETLRSMKVGEELAIKEKDFRPTSVSNACYRLKKEGFLFSCSAKKNIDGSKVIRLS
jgi:hypothetical protein